MDGARERTKVSPAISTVVCTEVEDEVMGELQSDRNLSVKNRVKPFTQSINEHCKEKLGKAMQSKPTKPWLTSRKRELDRV